MEPNASDQPDRAETNRIEPQIEKLAELQLNTSAHIETLIGIVERLNERQESFISVTNQKIAALEESQEQIQQNLNALIKIVDELIRTRPPE